MDSNKSNGIKEVLLVVLVGLVIYLFVKQGQDRRTIKELEDSALIMAEGRLAELKVEREIAEIRIKDIQVVVDSLKKADSIEDIKFKKTSLYYERKIKELKSINTVIGIDHIRDSILRANGLREDKR